MDFSELFSQAITATGIVFEAALPSLIVAAIFVIIGYVIGWVVKLLTIGFLKAASVDDWMKDHKLVSAIGHKKVSEVAGSIVKWYIFFVFLKQAVEIVNLVTLNQVLGFWIQYALTVIAAIVVIIAGLIIARYVRNAIESSRHSLRRATGLVAELMIVYVAIVMGINMMGLPTQLLELTFLIAFTGIMLAAGLVVGISFGLALKDEAKIIVKEMKRK
ncbi:MAG: hypothetical protein AABW59_04415 [archaeon]